MFEHFGKMTKITLIQLHAVHQPISKFQNNNNTRKSYPYVIIITEKKVENKYGILTKGYQKVKVDKIHISLFLHFRESTF